MTFKVGSKSQSVSGTWVSDSECFCETPNFVKEGPREAQVFLKQDGNDYTLQEDVFFQYYLNTLASTTIAFGPGVFKNNPIGSDVIFNIQARNTIGANRKSGRDLFFVKILKESDADALLNPKVAEPAEGEEVKEEESVEEDDGDEDDEQKKEMLEFDPAKLIAAEVIDLDNGTYEVKYKNESEEPVKIWVYYQNEEEQYEEIRGSPFTAEFSKAATAKNGSMEGKSLQEYISTNLNDISSYLSTTKTAVFIKDMDNWQQDVDKLLSI